MNQRFLQNVETLQHGGSAETVAAVLNPPADAPNLEVRIEDEGPIFRAAPPGRGPIAIHSPRRPLDEAERQVRRWSDRHCIRTGSLIICLGVGGGYHLPRLAGLLKENGLLLIIDPHPRAVRTALHHIDLSAWIHDRTAVRWIVNHDPEIICQEFLDTIQQRLRIDYSFFIHPGVLRVFHADYLPLPPRLAEQVRVDLMQRSTLFNLTRTWLDNAIRNLPLLLDSTPIDCLKGAFDHVPAVVAAAGPSLQECLPLLRELQQRMLVIAVGTAVRPLLAAGIRPHLVILVDASPALLRQFEGVEPGSLRLMIPAQIHPEVLALFPDRLISFGTCALPEYDAWMERLGAPADAIRAGGTVTVSAIDAAVYLGCSEVLVFGFDLAVQDDGASHVRHSMWEHHRHNLDELVAVPGNTRPTVLTTRQFASYIEVVGGVLAKLQKAGAPPIANVNSDGARIPNLAHRLPAEIKPAAWPIRDGLEAVIDHCTSIRRRGRRTAVRKGLHEVRHQLSAFALAANRASTLCREAADTTASDFRRNQDLLKQERLLTRTNSASDLLNGALRAESMDTLSFCAGTSQEDEHQFTAVHDRCAAFYQTVAKEAKWLRDRIRAAQDALAFNRPEQPKDPDSL